MMRLMVLWSASIFFLLILLQPQIVHTGETEMCGADGAIFCALEKKNEIDTILLRLNDIKSRVENKGWNIERELPYRMSPNAQKISNTEYLKILEDLYPCLSELDEEDKRRSITITIVRESNPKVNVREMNSDVDIVIQAGIDRDELRRQFFGRTMVCEPAQE